MQVDSLVAAAGDNAETFAPHLPYEGLDCAVAEGKGLGGPRE